MTTSLSQCEIELVYEIEGFTHTRFVVIEPKAINKMRALRQLSSTAHEAGGVLIGERRGGNIVVKDVTTPSSRDLSSRVHFVRNLFHHQLAIVKANQRTGGTSNYLGEWHTHPQDNPYPSPIDFNNWRASLRNHKPCLVAVIGRKGEWWSLYENGKYHSLILINRQIL
ncbi:Mov34/MPN/PAD-1 family protein [Vibrio brasiliensis]|uniref:Mov34/MPN/PAD-1 family protein n=1 Tax=Vibrio brasiliensis TaxID=170652 RepID=UPI001EFE51C8|nr:Mov34/MPN/PAD-1 family protein [Vibrio brasiliensis]MCG9649840.1 Mov34/MPN/PAD-1 family protein [Vibrio brasiliensis]